MLGSEVSSTLDLRDETTSCSSFSDTCNTPSLPPPPPLPPYPREPDPGSSPSDSNSENKGEPSKSPSLSPTPLISESGIVINGELLITADVSRVKVRVRVGVRLAVVTSVVVNPCLINVISPPVTHRFLLPAISEDELRSVCSTPETFTTPISTPYIRQTTNTSRHAECSSDPTAYGDNTGSYQQDKLLELEIQRVANEIIKHNISASLERLASADESADITNVSSLLPRLQLTDISDSLSNSEAPSVRTVLSDSVVNQINVTPPPQPPPNKPHRSEMCTPLSFSDSNLAKRPSAPETTNIAPPEKTQSLPGGIDNIATDVSDILSKKFRNKESYSSKSISDKLEEIQSKLSPRSFLNTSNTR